MQKFAVAKYFVLVYNVIKKGVEILGNQLNEDKLISLRIGKLRKDEGWTQKELSERMNVTEKFISNLETAKKPLSLKMAKLYSEMFGTTLDYIIYGRVEKKEERYTKLELQYQHCILNDKTMWIPKDGRCIDCHEDILEKHSLKKCSTQVVTDCSHCRKSYVD